VSPAAVGPFLEVRALVPERRVLAVARVDPGLVGQPVEDLLDDAFVEGGEARIVVLGVAETARESG